MGYNFLTGQNDPSPDPNFSVVPQGSYSTAPQTVIPQASSPVAAPSTSGAQDYLSQQQQMLARYQQMAAQMYPKNPVFGNDAFAQNHPRLAGAIGNSLLTLSQIHNQPTIGGNIGQVAGALLGTSRYGRQAEMEQQMMPYQMMNSQMGLQKTLADINELNARSAYYGQQDQRAQAEIAKAGFPHAISGPKVDDQLGKQWQTVMDPATGAVSDKPVGWTPPEGYSPTFKNEEKNQRMSTPGGLQGEIIAGLNSPDPAVQANAQKMKQQYLELNTARVAAATGANQGITQPRVDAQDLINTTRSHMYDDLGPAPEKAYEDWINNHYMDADHSQDAYQKLVATFQKNKAQRDQDVQTWQTSGAPMKGQNLQTWIQAGKPNYKQTPNSKAPAAKPQKQWDPVSGTYK